MNRGNNFAAIFFTFLTFGSSTVVWAGLLDEVRSEVCHMPPEKGPCRGRIRLFFYNATTDQCSEFTYGGCGGNSNAFYEQSICMMQCSPNYDHKNSVQLDPGANSGGKVLGQYHERADRSCYSDMVTGCTKPNVDKSTRFTYDVVTRRCLPILYCSDIFNVRNRNKYATKEDCEAKCEPSDVIAQVKNKSFYSIFGIFFFKFSFFRTQAITTIEMLKQLQGDFV